MGREGVSEMKAAVLTGIGTVEVRDVPRPEIVRSDDVLVRVGAVGVCGSDVHYYREGKITTWSPILPSR